MVHQSVSKIKVGIVNDKSNWKSQPKIKHSMGERTGIKLRVLPQGSKQHYCWNGRKNKYGTKGIKNFPPEIFSFGKTQLNFFECYFFAQKHIPDQVS